MAGDLAGAVARLHGRLDDGVTWTEIGPLLELKEAPEAADRLRAVLARARG